VGGTDGADHRVLTADGRRDARRIEYVAFDHVERLGRRGEARRVAPDGSDPVPAPQRFRSDAPADRAAGAKECDFL